MTKLKPCPFCGKKRLRLDTDGFWGAIWGVIECRCGVRLNGGSFKDKEEAVQDVIKRWNRRAE